MTGAAVTGVALIGVSSPGWHAALSEAWDAYVAGSLPIGACVIDAAGTVIARGRNRLNEPRGVAGVISGSDLAHAEINALLALQGAPRPDCYGWTVLTTVQPCPQCAGAIAMSGLRGVAYAAADPWAGCTHLLTDDPYVSRKRIRVERAPADVQRAALRLMLHALLDELQAGGNRVVLDSFDALHPQDVTFAEALHAAGTLAALRDQRAPLADALAVLA
ncbi:nucleoside deaminase [Deinococcus sedimenti]|uniref:nucleoside deaminase n=1 Tax=Deinococcus sedimenti TaxID=1867090 RepID=UPI001E30BE4B|nr:nucleoside deaminase [Deinococcus sedimenti]